MTLYVFNEEGVARILTDTEVNDMVYRHEPLFSKSEGFAYWDATGYWYTPAKKYKGYAEITDVLKIPKEYRAMLLLIQ